MPSLSKTIIFRQLDCNLFCQRTGDLSALIFCVFREYSLTKLGQSLKPILDAMQSWGEEYKESHDL
ncbi:winged helix-turn-helix transcriptional regulator [Lachnospiraceae bacterium 66-29]